MSEPRSAEPAPWCACHLDNGMVCPRFCGSLVNAPWCLLCGHARACHEHQNFPADDASDFCAIEGAH